MRRGRGDKAEPLRRQVAIKVEGDTLNVTYNERLLTPGILREVDRLERQGDVDGTVELLARLILEWDLQDEKGKPWPISRETLSELTYRELGMIQRAITEDLAPNLKTPENFGSF